MKKCWIGSIVIICFFVINVSARELIEVKLDQCVDGDTAWFIYNNKSSKFRFLAIDTPESTNKIEPYGKEASEFTCNELKKAKKIEIEFDSNSDKQDKYERFLAWIFVDGKLLQEKIINKGYAEIKYIYGEYKYLDSLKIIEKKAQAKKVGIYSNSNTNNTFDYLVITIGIILIVVLFLFNKKYRNKCLTKIKRKTRNKLKNSIKKIH